MKFTFACQLHSLAAYRACAAHSHSQQRRRQQRWRRRRSRPQLSAPWPRHSFCVSSPSWYRSGRRARPQSWSCALASSSRSDWAYTCAAAAAAAAAGGCSSLLLLLLLLLLLCVGGWGSSSARQSHWGWRLSWRGWAYNRTMRPRSAVEWEPCAWMQSICPVTIATSMWKLLVSWNLTDTAADDDDELGIYLFDVSVVCFNWKRNENNMSL